MPLRYPIAANHVRALQSANAIVRYKARFRIAESPAATVAVLSAEFGPHVSGASLQYRLIHSSPAPLSEASKPSSKIEETVNRLKEKTGESEVRYTEFGNLQTQGPNSNTTYILYIAWHNPNCSGNNH